MNKPAKPKRKRKKSLAAERRERLAPVELPEEILGQTPPPVVLANTGLVAEVKAITAVARLRRR